MQHSSLASSLVAEKTPKSPFNSTQKTYDFIIVGAGIVGLATAYKLHQKFSDATILVLEKEGRVGAHQTGKNSGVIHSGIYYKPGSLKAQNCKKGYDLMVNFAKENNISYDICGKLIVASNKNELEILNNIFENGKKKWTKRLDLFKSITNS